MPHVAHTARLELIEQLLTDRSIDHAQVSDRCLTSRGGGMQAAQRNLQWPFALVGVLAVQRDELVLRVLGGREDPIAHSGARRRAVYIVEFIRAKGLHERIEALYIRYCEAAKKQCALQKQVLFDLDTMRRHPGGQALTGATRRDDPQCAWRYNLVS